MISPEKQGHGTKNLGDMREWITYWARYDETLIRYDTIVDGEQHHCLYRGKGKPSSEELEQIRDVARTCLKNKQYGEFEVNRISEGEHG